ncbi:MAG: NAD(P)-binding protein, partial [Gammaproteobacteria bacterium]|nr:NAD(P)-binding protein [Gammaproteobacteria bacterium]
MHDTDLDIAIFGAGIAGLWTLVRLRQSGYRVATFERH